MAASSEFAKTSMPVCERPESADEINGQSSRKLAGMAGRSPASTVPSSAIT